MASATRDTRKDATVPLFSQKNPIIPPRRFEWSREYGRAELIPVTSPSILSFQKNELLQQSRAGIPGRLTSLDFPAFRKALLIYLFLESRPTPKNLMWARGRLIKKHEHLHNCSCASSVSKNGFRSPPSFKQRIKADSPYQIKEKKRLKRE